MCDGCPVVQGPYFEDLSAGEVFSQAPSMTLSAGRAALHQGIVGDRLRLSLDDELSRRVTGQVQPLVHPAFAWDIAIGQSTLVTRNVMANLFYRGLAFHRIPLVGDTLRTTTEVVALKQNARRPGRPATGLAVLRMSTVDQLGRTVLDFRRCAMLPLRDHGARTGHRDDLRAAGDALSLQELGRAVGEWNLSAFREAVPGGHAESVRPGCQWKVAGGDVVSSAPELARLTLNIATVHHDDAAGEGERLVYGGQTIGIALSQASRALPDLMTVVGWHACDHLGPVYEGDTLDSTVSVEGVDPLGLADGGVLVHLRSAVRARRTPDAPSRKVLNWSYVVVMA